VLLHAVAVSQDQLVLKTVAARWNSCSRLQCRSSNMAGLTTAQFSNIAAWGLGVGTAFFSFFGLKDDRDFFLVMGLLCCLSGNLVFAFFLWDQNPTGSGANETLVTLYLVLAAASLYALYAQFSMFREKGCGDDDREDSDAEEEAMGQEAPGLGAPRIGASKQPLSLDEQTERAALREVARKAIAVAKSEGSAATGSSAGAAASGAGKPKLTFQEARQAEIDRLRRRKTGETGTES